MQPILHSFDCPKCETCEHWERLRPHAGRCVHIATESLVYPQGVTTLAENRLEGIEDDTEMVTLDFFGCRFHTDIIPKDK